MTRKMTTSNSLNKETFIEPEIQEYFDFLDSITQETPNVVSKERILENLEGFGNAINTFWCIQTFYLIL